LHIGATRNREKNEGDGGGKTDVAFHLRCGIEVEKKAHNQRDGLKCDSSINHLTLNDKPQNFHNNKPRV